MDQILGKESKGDELRTFTRQEHASNIQLLIIDSHEEAEKHTRALLDRLPTFVALDVEGPPTDSTKTTVIQISDGKVVVLYRVKLIGDITPAMKELLADMRILKVSVNIHCEYTKSNISRFAY